MTGTSPVMTAWVDSIVLRRLLSCGCNRSPSGGQAREAWRSFRHRVSPWWALRQFLRPAGPAGNTIRAGRRSKYPPAKPGALGFEPLKAAEDATCVASSVGKSNAALTANWLFWQSHSPSSIQFPVCPPGPYSPTNSDLRASI